MQNIKDKQSLNKITHSVRASQAVLQYGVGAMVDFPEQTLMTAAPETWENSVEKIFDERLQKSLGVSYFGMPGSSDEARFFNGVSYTRFPEWYFCPKCRSFKPLKQWIEEYSKSQKTKRSFEKDPYMIHRLRCPNCFQDLVVARIIVACEHGHIDDFPWVKWVHAKNLGGAKKICDKPMLKFTTSASSTEGLEGLTVSCASCNCRTTLKGAFDKGALQKLDESTGYDYDFRCTGRHPWKNEKEACGEYPHVLQRGSSSVYFPITVSSLVIPPYSSRLTGMVENSISYSNLLRDIANAIKDVHDFTGTEITQEIKENIIKTKIKEAAKKISLEIGKSESQISAILERKWSGNTDPGYTTTSVKYRAEEYSALNGEVSLDDNGEFVRENTDINEYNIPYIKNISLIHKVREVQALVGFSRIEPIDGEEGDNRGKILKVDIKEKDTDWYPGYEVRGEGIFIEFDDDAIDLWRSKNIEITNRVNLLNDNYRKSYYGSLREREISAKFLLLHTLSHLLMKQLSFECGYSIASLKERIYCSEPAQGRSMSGIFIYTASGDSEGTMGGLVRQGRADIFPEIFRKAIEASVTCSNDPVCSLSQGQGRDSLNLSACYSCTLVPETSCEEYNVFLDRGTVIGTFEKPEIGFYSSYIGYVTNWKKKDTHAKDNISETNICVITDYGVDMSDVRYRDIWKSVMQFTDDSAETSLLSELIEKSGSFENKEKPWSGATFNTNDQTDVSVDLIWPKSKLMYFSSDNEEEYILAKDSDWICVFGKDASVSCEKLLKYIKEM